MPLRHTSEDIIKPGSVSSLLAPADALSLKATPAHGGSVALLCNGNCGEVQVGGKPYAIKNMHWHTPSEHTIDGRRTAAELHIVSFAGDGKIAVMSALFDQGTVNPLVEDTLNAMEDLADLSTTAQQIKRDFFSGAELVRSLRAASRARILFKHVAKATVAFNPFDPRAVAAREFLTRVQTPPVRKDNPKLTVVAEVLAKPAPPTIDLEYVDGTRQHIVAVGLTVDDLLMSVRAATRWTGSGDGGDTTNPFINLRRERLAAIAAEVAPGGGAATVRP
ncbi:hypothetical protein MMPV_008678 [Pyropia vietnamensis]